MFLPFPPLHANAFLPKTRDIAPIWSGADPVAPEPSVARRSCMYRTMAFVAILATIVFLIDIALPLGVAAGIPYLLTILLAGNTENRKFILFTCAFCTLLTILGFFFSPSGGEIWKVILNRSFSILVIWTIGIIVLRNHPKRFTISPNTRRADSSGDASIWNEQDDDFVVAPDSASDFFQCIRSSRVLEGSTVDELELEYAESAPSEIAKALVESGVLTKHQAAMLFHGKTKGLVFGNFVVLDQVGRGGVGLVFRALNKRTREIVALKVLQAKSLESQAARKRFAREISATTRLSHENIVQAYDAGNEDDVYYLVMELVKGRDLRRLVISEGPLPLFKAADYVLQTAKGMAYAHKYGIVHRDLKPSNLIVSDEGIVKILDLGLARFTGGTGDTESVGHTTQVGAVGGSLEFMAPEQALDFKNADERADIYSLGCTLSYLLGGEISSGDSPLNEKLRILIGGRGFAPEKLEAPDCEVPEKLQDLYSRMIEPSPSDRVDSMDTVVDELTMVEFDD